MDASVTDWIQAASAFVVALWTAALVWVTRQYARSTKQMADVMARDYETRNSPLVDLIIGYKQHSTEGFKIQVLVSNFGFQPVTLHSLKFDWWLSDQSDKVSSKEFPVPSAMATLPPQTDKQEFKIRLSEQEAWCGRGDIPDLRALRLLLYGKARIEFYSGPRIQEGNVQTGMHRRETPAFQIQKP